jgi:1,4-alpha-glucan branching enzyme
VGLPEAGEWTELLNTDSTYYGGTGVGNLGGVVAEKRPWHDQPYSALLTLPPLSMLWLRPES